MFKLFDPQTKVQKDRIIIKDTDARMAKYSRRGIISNFLIYALCLVFEGTFIHQHRNLAIALTGGLLFVTLVRGYFLFRFDTIYPKGPGAWRNKYFLATLAGATWWGVILATFTLYLDLKGESSLMWLYTVVFFSTTAHAFAPYKRFLSIYQFIGLVPASLCTFFIGEYMGAFYGFVLLIFYIILNYHCSLMSLNYWERLEAQYILAKKSVSLEEEKRDTRASVQLAKEYVQLLNRELEAMVAKSTEGAGSDHENLKKLQLNVDAFRKVLTKEVTHSDVVFNIRHLLQNIVRSYIERAEVRGLQFETSLSPALPARMIGNAHQIANIFSIMMTNVLTSAQSHTLFIDAEFVRDYENSGQLLLSISKHTAGVKRSRFQSEASFSLDADLDLVLAKGLAETLNGSLYIDELGASDGKYLTLRSPLKVAEAGARPEYHRLAYKGRRLLIVHENAHVLHLKRLELEAMGFDVQISDDFKSAFQILKGALSAGTAIQSVVYMASPSEEDTVGFCNNLLEHNELKYIHQFVVCSKSGQEFFSARIVAKSTFIHFVDRPAGFFEFESAFCCVFEITHTHFLNGAEEQDQLDTVPDRSTPVLWLSLKRESDYAAMFENEFENIESISDLKQIKTFLQMPEIRVIVVEFNGSDSIASIQVIRNEEKHLGRATLIPIVGVGPISEKMNMLEAGVDYFIDFESLSRGTVPALSFWLKGGHH